MQELKYIRKDNKIFEADGKTLHEKFESINKAKKESHKLQLTNGGLGRGSLRVE